MTRLVTGACCAALFIIGGLEARAQGDLSGKYIVRLHEDQPERIPGPELADFAGLPINDSARQFALSWDPGRLTLPEHQCRSHSVPYIFRGPGNLRIWEERDPETQTLMRTMMYLSNFGRLRTIWMDGRPHPSASHRHTWMGFSTGKWEGNRLLVKTTHIKQMWHRRNGLPQSDLATLTEQFMRQGNHLTRISVTEDPVYLTEPLIKSESFLPAPEREGEAVWAYPCDIVVEVPRPQGFVPHYLPGENRSAEELERRWNIDAESWSGGAQTMYPEYARTHGIRVARPATP